MKPDLISKDERFLKPSGKWIIFSTVVAALAISGFAIHYALHFQRSFPRSLSSSRTVSPTIRAVSALGHLRPEGEVVYLAAPSVPNELGVNRVAKLLVKQGEKVKLGQIVAVLDSYENLQTSLKLAIAEVKVTQANLAGVKAGAKTGEIEAQKANIRSLKAQSHGELTTQKQAIARLEAQLSNSQSEYRRYQQLFQNGGISASQLDIKRLTMNTAFEQLNEAKANRNGVAATSQQQIEAAQATLAQIAEVRPTDVQMAQAEIDRAIAKVAKAQADLNLAYVYAPIDGQILKINTRPGEVAGSKGIVALGQTASMNVIAEVYELDVSRLRFGQKAIITSNGFPGKLYGTVREIGLQINPQAILSTDPTADVDSRIVEVKISLNSADSQKVSSLTNLQVNVVIKD